MVESRPEHLVSEAMQKPVEHVVPLKTYEDGVVFTATIKMKTPVPVTKNG